MQSPATRSLDVRIMPKVMPLIRICKGEGANAAPGHHDDSTFYLV